MDFAETSKNLVRVVIEGTIPRGSGPKEEDGGGSSSGRLRCIARRGKCAAAHREVPLRRHPPLEGADTLVAWRGHVDSISRPFRSAWVIKLARPLFTCIIVILRPRGRAAYLWRNYSALFSQIWIRWRRRYGCRVASDSREILRGGKRRGKDNRARSKSDRSRNKGGTEFLPPSSLPSLGESSSTWGDCQRRYFDQSVGNEAGGSGRSRLNLPSIGGWNGGENRSSSCARACKKGRRVAIRTRRQMATDDGRHERKRSIIVLSYTFRK